MCFAAIWKARGEAFIVDIILHGRQLQIITIQFTPYDDVPKLHLITSQCPCLISKNILHLPQFLIDTDRPAFQSSIIERTVHFLILGHEIALEDLDELQGDDETDGDEGAVEDEVGRERNACQTQTGGFSSEDELLEGVCLSAAVVGVAGTNETADGLQGEDDEDEAIYSFLDVACFGEGVTAIHHNCSVLSRVYDDTQYPIRILKLAPPQNHVLFIDFLPDVHLSIS